jgi:hypothetical protein
MTLSKQTSSTSSSSRQRQQQQLHQGLKGITGRQQTLAGYQAGQALCPRVFYQVSGMDSVAGG